MLEILFNIFHQDIRKAFPLIKKTGTGTIAKVPLDSGWLSGRYNSGSRFTGIRNRWSPDQINLRAELLQQIDWLTEDGSELSQKALAFILSYEEISCVIPGTRSVEHLNSSIAAAGQTLTSADRKKIERLWAQKTNSGETPLPW